MKHGFYSRLAAENIRTNRQLYVPRILAEAGLLGCFYILVTLTGDSRMKDALGGAYLSLFMSFGSVVIGLLSFILILYVNSFLMKRRKSEYGLYNVLGMEKRHIIRLLFCESLIASLLSVALGLIFGMVFYKACSLLICRLLHAKVVAGFYYLSLRSLSFPAAVFFALDLFAFLVNSLAILRLKPVELLAERHAGEKEPRVRRVILLIGLITLAAGYTIAVTVRSPLQAILLFFAAVILVIIGTYCLYVTGTTFVLKCLKKKRRYYYDPNHMPAVSGLLYRMKQNAVGLASIAILATGVLVMISTTVSLYSGVQDTMDAHYPQQIYLSANRTEGDTVRPLSFDELSGIVTESAQEYGVGIRSITNTHMLVVPYLMRGNALLTGDEAGDLRKRGDLTSVIYITESTYRQLLGQIYFTSDERFLGLEENEIAFCRIMSTVRDLGNAPEMLAIHGTEYRVKEVLAYFPVNMNTGGAADVVGIVVADDSVLDRIYRSQKESYGTYASDYFNRIGVSVEDEASAGAVDPQLRQTIAEKLEAAYPQELSYSLDTRWETEHNILDMYGTFLFLGILLGFVCLFSTILIIYYKQISEGYEDRERYQIMEKVGMDAAEVRKTISSQLTLQFFLPLVTAGIHTAFAFPILLKMLKVLMLTNTQLFVICTVLTFAVFAAVYAAVYYLTARTYYRIVH